MGVYLITGAAGNLGRAVVEKLAAEGQTIVAAVSPNHHHEMFSSGLVKTVSVDALDEQKVGALVKSVAGRHGTLDGLVALVGGFSAGTIAETGLDLMEKMIRLNFYTAYSFSKPAFLQMQQQASGGRMVFIGSRPALHLREGKSMIAYALSKSLLFSLAGFFNARTEKTGVSASVLVPGTLDTDQNRKAMPDADFSKWTAPADAAAVVWKLVSERNPGPFQPVVEL